MIVGQSNAHTLTTLPLWTVASRSADEKPVGPYPPNMTPWSGEILVNVKSLVGVGTSPMTSGTLHSAIKQRKTKYIVKEHISAHTKLNNIQTH